MVPKVGSGDLQGLLRQRSSRSQAGCFHSSCPPKEESAVTGMVLLSPPTEAYRHVVLLFSIT